MLFVGLSIDAENTDICHQVQLPVTDSRKSWASKVLHGEQNFAIQFCLEQNLHFGLI